MLAVFRRCGCDARVAIVLQVSLAAEFSARMSYDPSQVSALVKEFGSTMKQAREEVRNIRRAPTAVKKQVRALLSLS